VGEQDRVRKLDVGMISWNGSVGMRPSLMHAVRWVIPVDAPAFTAQKTGANRSRREATPAEAGVLPLSAREANEPSPTSSVFHAPGVITRSGGSRETAPSQSRGPLRFPLPGRDVPGSRGEVMFRVRLLLR
jgi:hypothetical protein